MTPLAFYRHLLSIGTPEDAAYDIATKFEASEAEKVRAIYEGMLASLTKDAKADERRRRDRERKAAKKAGIPQNSEDSTGKAGIPQNAEPAKDAPTRVRDNLPRLVTNYDTIRETRERDFKSREDLDWLEAQLVEAAGPALASKAVATELFKLNAIIGLLRPGEGPACDLEADVLPAIRSTAARVRPASVKSWKFFASAIAETRDARLSGAPEVGVVTPMPRGQGPPSITDRIGAEQAEARRLAFARMDRQHG